MVASLSPAQAASLAPICVDRSRVHNLKDVSVKIPKMCLTVVTGPSGSGKSSLVWDTIHAEAQRQHLETFDAFARSRLPKASQADVDRVTGLATPVAVSQCRTGANSRSTVGTAGDLAPSVRLLFSRCGLDSSLRAADFSFNGSGACEKCQGLGTVTELQTDLFVDKSKSLNGGALLHHSFANKEGCYFRQISDSGLFDMGKPLSQWPEHVLEVLLDIPTTQLTQARKLIDGESQGQVGKGGKNKAAVVDIKKGDTKKGKRAAKAAPECEMSAKRARTKSGAPQTVSNSGYRKTTDPTLPIKTWTGIMRRLRERVSKHGEAAKGEKKDTRDLEYFSSQQCRECNGSRLHQRARESKVAGKSIVELGKLELSQLLAWLESLTPGSEQAGACAVSLDDTKRATAAHVIADLRPRVKAVCDIGLGYLTLDRATSTLSGGESQRLRIARHIQCGLTGVLYVLDEPTVGLHAKDIDRIIVSLRAMRDAGNTVLVVEHNPSVIQAADHVVEIGPESGTKGGKVVFDGAVEALLKATTTATSRALSELHLNHVWREVRTPKGFLDVTNVTAHNLHNVSVRFPLGCLVAVTGVSGSGKSTLVHHGLVQQHGAKVVIVDQSGVGRSSFSNLATYSDALDPIRTLFHQQTGEDKGLFSFNSTGACQHCNGSGSLAMEMMFIDAPSLVCPGCAGRRYHDDVLTHRVRGKSIADVLSLTVDQAIAFFDKDATIRSKIITLQQVGLGYLSLGQSLSTLSGGEAQRLKLASGLNKKAAFYILDEITIGLHHQDVKVVMDVLHRIVDQGIGIVLIEHNLHAVALCDYVIDVGPGAGRFGGKIVAQGTPEELVRNGEGATAQAFKTELRF